ncbi:SGNH/GDSL hydrolase family protein [Gordonia sp. (in: high G+C Gram-positive bacteria)]|uniref:SGNH/GDSL hydrolase family protein n=1 Tax=Gordonia sp. (in: high G+C Gram-positive bacteria) TaxID=84139 RepID=UPI003C72BBAB
MRYSRFVAIGDSQTEGMNDGDPKSGYRGWADRLAESLAATNPGVRYANLAVRGKTTHDALIEQLEPALALQPDLVAAPLGMNDVIGGSNLADVHHDLDQIFGRLVDSGATVLVSTFPDIARLIPFGGRIRNRLDDLNAMTREFAHTYDLTLVDLFSAPVLTDRRSWSSDRLHASASGHDRFAAGAAYALRLPGSSPDWGRPLPSLPDPNPLLRTVDDARWVVEFFTPWIIRKLRGRSLGDGRAPKLPELIEVAIDLAVDVDNSR